MMKITKLLFKKSQIKVVIIKVNWNILSKASKKGNKIKEMFKFSRLNNVLEIKNSEEKLNTPFPFP